MPRPTGVLHFSIALSNSILFLNAVDSHACPPFCPVQCTHTTSRPSTFCTIPYRGQVPKLKKSTISCNPGANANSLPLTSWLQFSIVVATYARGTFNLYMGANRRQVFLLFLFHISHFKLPSFLFIFSLKNTILTCITPITSSQSA